MKEKKMKNKKMTFLLILVLVLTMIPIMSFGDDDQIGGALSGNTGVNVNLFNYGKGINDEAATRTFGFFDTENRAVDYSKGITAGNGTQSIVDDKLDSDGYPIRSANGENMSYLFKPEDIAATDYDNRFTSTTNYTKKYFPVASDSGLFTRDETTGNYTYSSDKNHAYYNPQTQKFELHDYLLKPYHNAVDNNSKTAMGNFLPFNMPYSTSNTVGTYNGIGVYDTLSRAEANEASRNLSVTEKAIYNTDLWFGMTVDFDFFQPRDGKLNGNAMEFAFEGDDDVFVFIDGVRILDLGGTHAAEKGTINFATGDINNRGSETTIKQCFIDAGTADDTMIKLFGVNWENPSVQTFADYTDHSFNFYYLERGGNISFCSLSFNMPVVENPYPLIVEKQVTGDTMNDPDQTFDYKLIVTEGDNTTPVTGSYIKYKVYDSGNQQVENGTTDENGVFKLKAGQKAVFDEGAYAGETAEAQAFSNNVTSYQIQEINIDTKEFPKVTAKNEYFDYTESKTVVSTNASIVCSEDADGEDMTLFKARSHVTFTNEHSNPQTLELTKTQTGTDTDTEFTFLVSAGGALYNGSYFDGASKEVTVNDGIVKLKAGETAKFVDMKPGTKGVIEEVDIPPYYTADQAKHEFTIGTDDVVQSIVINNHYAKSDLDASKESSVPETTAVAPGKHITYSITVENNGNATATGIVIKDYLPEFTEFVSVGQGGTHGGIGTEEYVAWLIDEIAPGSSETVTFTVKVAAEFGEDDEIVNEGLFEEYGTTTGIEFNKDPEEKTNEVVNKPALPSMSVVKSNIPDKDTNVNAGDTIKYAVTVNNDGETALDQVWIKDYIPANTTYTDGTASDNGYYDSDNKYLEWVINEIPAGTSKTVSFEVTVNDDVEGGTVITNVGYVEVLGEGGEPGEGDPGLPTNEVINNVPVVLPDYVEPEDDGKVQGEEASDPVDDQQTVLGEEAKTDDSMSSLPYLLILGGAALAVLLCAIWRMTRRED